MGLIKALESFADFCDAATEENRRACDRNMEKNLPPRPNERHGGECRYEWCILSVQKYPDGLYYRVVHIGARAECENLAVKFNRDSVIRHEKKKCVALAMPIQSAQDLAYCGYNVERIEAAHLSHPQPFFWDEYNEDTRGVRY